MNKFGDRYKNKKANGLETDRRYVPYKEAIEEAEEFYGIMVWLLEDAYEIEAKGVTKDGTKQWFRFTDVYGEPAYTTKPIED